MNKNNIEATKQINQSAKVLINDNNYTKQTYDILKSLRDKWGWLIEIANKYTNIWLIVYEIVVYVNKIRAVYIATLEATNQFFIDKVDKTILDTSFRGLISALNELYFIDDVNIDYTVETSPEGVKSLINITPIIWTNSQFIPDDINQNQLIIDVIGNSLGSGAITNGDIEGFFISSENNQSISIKYSIGLIKNITITLQYVRNSQELLDFSPGAKVQSLGQEIVNQFFNRAGNDVFFQYFYGIGVGVSGVMIENVLITDGTTTISNQNWVTPANEKNIIIVAASEG